MDRIELIGESAAAGYLYAPDFTPAGVLEHLLRQSRRAPELRVEDGTRTSETLAGLRTACRRALERGTDALVLFAGNNWNLLETPEVSPYVPIPEALRTFGRSLAQRGITGPIEDAAHRALQLSVEVLNEIYERASSRDVQLVLVIPEVNLADWQNRQPPLWLQGDDVAHWYRSYFRACDALARGDFARLDELSERMIELDGATCPTSFRLAGLADLGRGNEGGATRSFRSEIEANQYATMAFLGAPQISTMFQETLRRFGTSRGLATVDLPTVFAHWNSGSIPGRELFLDYCHLTSKGIRLAMAAVAAALGSTESNTHPAALFDDAPRPSPEVEARAQLGAALHTAHRMSAISQKTEILEYWCRSALRASPRIAASMLDVIEARTARCAAPLSAAHRRNECSAYPLQFSHGWRSPAIDALIIRTLLKVLDRKERATARELISRQVTTSKGLDLAASTFHLEEPVERFYPLTMEADGISHAAPYRAAWPHSRFCFVSGPPSRHTLEIVARRPSPAPELTPNRPLPVAIGIGNRILARLMIRSSWTKHRLRLPAKSISPGLNRLTIYWPMVETAGDRALRSSAERLQEGISSSIHPIFGEVFRLWLTSEATAETRTKV